ncbi:MAG: hypothetical protein FWE48_03935 [Coriobacteriia bacterium]|nr:hypothetical protein [Coriobacteriia bacterium]MCL2746226.1 hypothetical protein [Coriobacteriia bacterium]MCL2870771.1 hypothetical protein [Coriobacteriia bacterium]
MASTESAISDREVIEAIAELRGDIKRVETKIDTFSDPCDLATEAYAMVRQTQHEQGVLETQLGILWWAGSVVFVAVVGLIIQSFGKKHLRKDA